MTDSSAPASNPDRDAGLSVSGPVSRRRLLLGATSLGAAALAGSALTGCAKANKSSGTATASDTLKIGYVSSQTGSLSNFTVSDGFVVKTVLNALSKGITVGGKNYKIEIVVRDSGSNPNKAGQMATELIQTENVDLMVATATPDTTNPVANQCESNGIPNVGTVAPWEAWYYGRGAKPGSAFKYTTLFFWGLEQLSSVFMAMWDKFGGANHKVGCMWPNDTDADAFRAGFAPVMAKRKYTVVDGGRYTDGITDFTSEIAKLKAGKAELFTCASIPPDFQVFWKQANQQGYKPKLATVARVMLFPTEAESLGPLSKNIATDAWWSPYHPYKSSLDGTSAKQLADDFTTQTGKQWNQAMGSIYSLFEVAVQAFKSASDPKDRDDVAHQLTTMKTEGMSGQLDFTAGPVPGVALQKPVGAQWREGTKFPWDLYIVDNSQNTSVSVNGDLQATNP